MDEKVDNSGWRIKIVAGCGYTHQIVGQKWVPGGALLSRGKVWPVILLLFLSSTHYCPLFHPLLSEIYPLLTTLRPSKGGLKRQSLLQTWCGSAPCRGPSANGYDAWRLDPADPRARSLQLLLQTWCGSADHPQMVTTPGVLDPADPRARSLQLLLQTWCGSAPRRGPSANGYDAWRFGSCGPARKILAAAA